MRTIRKDLKEAIKRDITYFKNDDALPEILQLQLAKANKLRKGFWYQ